MATSRLPSIYKYMLRLMNSNDKFICIRAPGILDSTTTTIHVFIYADVPHAAAAHKLFNLVEQRLASATS